MTLEGHPRRSMLWVGPLRESARRTPSDAERAWLRDRAVAARRVDTVYRRVCVLGCLASPALATLMLVTSPLGTGPTVAPSDITTALCASAPAGFGLVCSLAEIAFGFAWWRRALFALTLAAFVLGLVWFSQSTEQFLPAIVLLAGFILAMGGTLAGVVTALALPTARREAGELESAAEDGTVVTFSAPAAADGCDSGEPLQVLVPAGLVHVRSVADDGAQQPATVLGFEGADETLLTRNLTFAEQRELREAARNAVRASAGLAAALAFVGAHLARFATKHVDWAPAVVWSCCLAPAIFTLLRALAVRRSLHADADEGVVMVFHGDEGGVEFLPRSQRVFSVGGVPEGWRGHDAGNLRPPH